MICEVCGMRSAVCGTKFLERGIGLRLRSDVCTMK